MEEVIRELQDKTSVLNKRYKQSMQEVVEELTGDKLDVKG